VNLQIQGSPVPVLQDREVYKYLELLCTCGTGWDKQDVRRLSVQQRLDTYVDKCTALFRHLHPAQALEAIRTFGFLCLLFHFWSARLAQGIAADAGASVRRVVRVWLHLPQDSSKGYLHGDFWAGGIGLPCVEEEVAIQALAQAAKLIQSRDARVCQAAAGDLMKYVQRAHSGHICDDVRK
jgi:hypothetical protein